MSNYWVCRQDENGGFVYGWVGPTQNVETAKEWAKFYTAHSFEGSCSLTSVVVGELGDDGLVIAEFVRGRQVNPDTIHLKIPDGVDEKRPPF